MIDPELNGYPPLSQSSFSPELTVDQITNYDLFVQQLEGRLQLDWTNHGGVTRRTRAEITVQWLNENSYNLLFMPDGETLIGDSTDRDAVRSAMMLDMIDSVACRFMLDRNGYGGKKDLRWAKRRAMVAIKRVQSSLDDYLSTSGYHTDSKDSTQAFEDLIGMFNQARLLAFLGPLDLSTRDLRESRANVLGMLSEYKVLRSLHKLGYEQAFITNISQDGQGFDIGIPYMDPRHSLSATKFIQVKTGSPRYPLTSYRIGRNGSQTIVVPAINSEDYFSLSEQDETRFASIMDGFLPRALTIPEISSYE